MPEDHQKYLEWNGDRFRIWAKEIGINTYTVIDRLLTSQRVEQQAYRGCMGIRKLSEKYSKEALEEACKRALTYTATPSFKSIKNILSVTDSKKIENTDTAKETRKTHGITRGAAYYRR